MCVFFTNLGAFHDQLSKCGCQIICCKLIMEARRLPLRFLLWISAAAAIFSLCGRTTVQAYKNYTLAWTDAGRVNYKQWASDKSFSLGDFIIFKSDTNHTVMETYNVTVYNNCESDADDVHEYTAGEPSGAVRPATYSVPLVHTGLNYYFSGLYDGQQCRSGFSFAITVAKGAGLPPSLAPPSPAAPGPSDGDDDSAPAADVPSSVTNPLTPRVGSAPSAAAADDNSDQSPNVAADQGFFSAAAVAAAAASLVWGILVAAGL